MDKKIHTDNSEIFETEDIDEVSEITETEDIDENIIYVSRGYDTEKQYGTDFALHDFHFITEDLWEGDSPVDVSFKIRHTDTFMKGTLTRGNGLFQIHSHEPLQGIAPGQFGVLYDKDAEICVGSGEITLP